MNRCAPYLLLLLLLVACFSMATVIQPRTTSWSHRTGTDNFLQVMMGDGRRLFANHFFVKADVSFHSGYYPSIFDQAQAPKDSRHMSGDHGADEEKEHERQMNFLGPPRDWIEKFGRNFQITRHEHLAGSKEREMLPWLKISADLDPQRIETYTVAAYWLRRDLNKPAEAEKFLREGLRNNPGNYELLFELGRLYSENYHDQSHARNLWEMALRSWHSSEDKKEKPDLTSLEEIAMHLARVEEEAGHLQQAIEYLGTAAKCSPVPQVLEKQAQELRRRLANGGAAAQGK